MLKKRIIALLPIKGGIVVQSKQFRQYLPIGKPKIAVEFLNSWGVDEICLVKIDAKSGEGPDLDLLASVNRFAAVPVTYGGGIRHIDDVRAVIAQGADKVLLNRALLQFPQLLTQVAETFGAQCGVASIDFARDAKGKPQVFDHETKRSLNIDPLQLMAEAEKRGAGEILMNSVDRDGTKTGLDLEFLEAASTKTHLPFIACGGAGHPSHIVDALLCEQISAVAVGNMLNFSEHSVTTIKQFLKKNRFDKIRCDTAFTYEEHAFLDSGRINKKSDEELDELLFQFHPKEVI